MEPTACTSAGANALVSVKLAYSVASEMLPRSPSSGTARFCAVEKPKNSNPNEQHSTARLRVAGSIVPRSWSGAGAGGHDTQYWAEGGGWHRERSAHSTRWARVVAHRGKCWEGLGGGVQSVLLASCFAFLTNTDM